jgi:hypothetical protein
MKRKKKHTLFNSSVIPLFFSTGEILQAPTIGLGLLVISCILFDFAAQACFNPCESLIYDTCKGTSQESSCFFVYSFMTSFGNLLNKQKMTCFYFILFYFF